MKYKEKILSEKSIYLYHIGVQVYKAFLWKSMCFNRISSYLYVDLLVFFSFLSLFYTKKKEQMDTIDYKS